MTAFLLKYWLHIAIGLAVVGFCWWLRHDGYIDGKAEVQKKYDAHLAADKEATDKANAEYRAKEQKGRDRLAEIGFQYERDKMAALDKKDAVIAELRDGTLKLRKQWRGCPAGVPGPSEGSGSADDAPDLREAGAAELVRLGASCDAQVKGLQDVVRADRL